jgi:uncharacterized protein (TIGR03437 family)
MNPLTYLLTGLLVNVLTYQYGNTRAGANQQETILTPANVNSAQFGKLFSQSVDGYIYGQPLYLSGVAIPGKGSHNAVYVATEHDSVYAFDADRSVTALWQTSFLDASAGVTSVPASDTGCGQIVPEIGITSTPVIDAQAGTIYVVAMTKESGTYVQRLHALDVTTGAERPGSPVAIQASVPGTGEGGTSVVFRPRNYKQRPGLLLLNGVVYTLWSSHCDGGAYHGWIIGYDAQSLRQVTIYNSTPNGNEASFWAGGAAPAVDAVGNMYVVSGNGTFDYASGGPDLGESYIKLSTNGALAVMDYFTPYNYGPLNNGDVDTGSAGVALLGDEAGSSAHPHLMAGAGKEGRIYLLDRDNLGKLESGSDSQIVQSIPNAVNSYFGNPAYFNKRLYFCGASIGLKAYTVANAQMSATPESLGPDLIQWPGCVPTISANGTSSGIVWVLDAAGLLRAYDATNVATVLYNSNQNKSRDALGGAVKFSVPMVANGKVYAGTQTALVVYGLLAQDTAITVANAASGSAGPLAPGSIASLYGTGLPASPAVTVNGVTAPIFGAISSQINLQIPFEVGPGTAMVNLMASSGVVGGATIQIQTVGPGMFTQAGGGAAVLNQDYSVNGQGQPAAVGSVIAAYLTGLGPVQPRVATGVPAPLNALSRTTGSVTATIGGIPATVEFSGLAPGYTGLYQVNVLVPQLPSGQYPLQISVNGVAANAAPISIR